MNIKALTKKMHTFVDDMGWYKDDSPRQQTIRNLAISLSLESSEVLELFQWGNTSPDRSELASELADVTLYLLQLASLAQIDLEQAVITKLDHNYSREWEYPIEINTSGTDAIERMNKPKVAVFGGSKPKQEDDAYKLAHAIGRALGENGFNVVTGGYIGTMEAVSKGASETGVEVIGITCDEIENWRPVKPNGYITKEIRQTTLRDRINMLIDISDAAIVLDGGIGTMAELFTMWSQVQIGAIASKPLILYGSTMRKYINEFYKDFDMYISEQDRPLISSIGTIDDLIKILNKQLR